MSCEVMGRCDGFEVEQRGLELLHEIDEVLLRGEVAEGVAGDAETDGQVGVGGGRLEGGGCVGGWADVWARDFGGQERGGGGECAGAQEGAASEGACRSLSSGAMVARKTGGASRRLATWGIELRVIHKCALGSLLIGIISCGWCFGQTKVKDSAFPDQIFPWTLFLY